MYYHGGDMFHNDRLNILSTSGGTSRDTIVCTNDIKYDKGMCQIMLHLPCLHHRRYSYISKCACEGVTIVGIIVVCFAFWSYSSTLHCSLIDALIADLLNPPFLLILALLPPLD